MSAAYVQYKTKPIRYKKYAQMTAESIHLCIVIYTRTLWYTTRVHFDLIYI